MTSIPCTFCLQDIGSFPLLRSLTAILLLNVLLQEVISSCNLKINNYSTIVKEAVVKRCNFSIQDKVQIRGRGVLHSRTSVHNVSCMQRRCGVANVT